MAAFEVIALDTATPQLRAPGASDTYTFPRAVEMPLGTANGVLFLNGSKVVTSGSGLTFDGTNLGVGANSPSFKLDVRGDNGLQMSNAANTNALRFVPGSGVYNINMAGSTHELAFTDLNGASELMRLTSTGLGIGTSSPASKLTVSRNGSAGLVSNFTDGLAQGLALTTGTGYFGFFNPNYGAITFRDGANAIENMHLTDSGNLGLGVTPSAWSAYTALQVNNSSLGYYPPTVDAVWAANTYYNSGWKYIASGAASYLRNSPSGFEWYLAPSGTAGNAVSFTQAMTLDASGNLGIGLSSPLVKLHIADPTSATVRVTSIGNANLDMTCSATQAIIGSPNGIPLLFNTSNTERMRLDSSGSLGLGVTPSAWSGVVAMQLPTGAALTGFSNTTNLAQNAYYNGSWRYISTAAAALAQVTQGAHQWFTAPSGTAGNAISFTQAMTLDASGRLLIGTTTAGIGNNGATALSIANGTATVYQSIRASGGEELYLYAASGSVGLYAYSNNELSFGTNNTTRLRLKSTGQLRYVPLSSDPAGAEAGDVYYNSSTNKLRVYNGTAWVDLH